MSNEEREPRVQEPSKVFKLQYGGNDEGAHILAKADLAKHGKWLEDDWWQPNEGEMQPRVRIERAKYRIVGERAIAPDVAQETVEGVEPSAEPNLMPFKVVIYLMAAPSKGMFSSNEMKLDVLRLDEQDGVLVIQMCDGEGRWTGTRRIPLINVQYYDLPPIQAHKTGEQWV